MALHRLTGSGLLFSGEDTIEGISFTPGDDYASTLFIYDNTVGNGVVLSHIMCPSADSREDTQVKITRTGAYAVFTGSGPSVIVQTR